MRVFILVAVGGRGPVNLVLLGGTSIARFRPRAEIIRLPLKRTFTAAIGLNFDTGVRPELLAILFQGAQDASVAEVIGEHRSRIRFGTACGHGRGASPRAPVDR